MKRFIKSRERWQHRGDESKERLPFLVFGLLFVFILIAARLFVLQILSYEFYSALAAGKGDFYSKLKPNRGTIYVHDRGKEDLYPVAANTVTHTVYAEPNKVKDAEMTAKKLAPILGLEEPALIFKLDRMDDPYEPIARRVSDSKVAEIREKNLPGIGFARESTRVYPEVRFGGHILGFMGEDENGARGRYGLEGYFETELAGTPAKLGAARSGLRALISSGSKPVFAADGSDLVLTVDRTIQFVACDRLQKAVTRHNADGGTVIIMHPKTGAILAMCSSPDYDPNHYSEVSDVSIFNNPSIFFQYEPGSVFKPITMSAALDLGKVNSQTTYNDTGSVKIGSHEIKNSDQKAHGTQTMAQVLENSLNTGAVFAMKQVGAADFRRYVKAFGFGEVTGVELMSEVPGDISSLTKRGEIYAVTASFGQGIAVTPLQLVRAFAAIANGGTLVNPYIVDEIRRSDGTIQKSSPREVRRVLSPRAATLLSDMLVSVVENGHGKRARVPGYFVAGKTGTAQVPRADGKGYQKDVTIGSFVGFAPVRDPQFVMLVRLDHPRDVQWAESTAAPLFGDIAKFLLQYMNVPPERE